MWSVKVVGESGFLETHWTLTSTQDSHLHAGLPGRPAKQLYIHSAKINNNNNNYTGGNLTQTSHNMMRGSTRSKGERRGLTFFLRELREFVDVFTTVLTAWHAKPEVEVKGLETAISEEVSLNHSEVLHGLIAHCELNPGMEKMSYCLKGVCVCESV